MTDHDLAERLHAPDVTLSASRRRADFIRPQEHRMHDRYRIDLARRPDGWHAAMHSPDATEEPVVYADAEGPGRALEVLGQTLDGQEAGRLAAEVREEVAGRLTLEEAVKRERAADVAAVVKVLEETDRRLGTQGAVTTQDVAVRAGFVDDTRQELSTIGTHEQRLAAIVGTVEERHEAAVSRARHALEQAARDGVVVRLASPIGELWRLATDDEIEEASR